MSRREVTTTLRDVLGPRPEKPVYFVYGEKMYWKSHKHYVFHISRLRQSVYKHIYIIIIIINSN